MRTAGPKGAKGRCDVLFSKIVRARGACEACGSVDRLQCAHIISRRYSATRCWEPNAFCLCASCHLRFTNWPLEFAAFVTDTIGDAAYGRLRTMANLGVKVDWAELAASLAGRWQELAA